MKTIRADKMGLYTADPMEYRFIDIVKVKEDEAWGCKLASTQDWYFKIHFPEYPVMPGVFVMEAIMQTGVFIVTTREDIKEKLMMFHACKSMRMYREVRPGDILNTHVILKSYRGGVASYFGEAFIEDDKKACQMEFTLILPGELKKMTPETRD